MGLSVFTITAAGCDAHVRCDACIAAAPQVVHSDRHKALQEAERTAEDQGFVHYPSKKTWLCPTCRIKRLPDHLKAYLPNLCAQHGIEVPGEAPATPAAGKGKQRKSRK